MAHASSSTARPGRSNAFVVSGLLLAGLVWLIQFAPAQNARDKATTKGKDKSSAAAQKPAGPTTLKMTIVSKDPDVDEMTRVIHARLEARWTANKITPSHYCDD